MAQRNACHPGLRPAVVVSRSERLAQLEAEGEKLGEEFHRLQDEEDAEREAAEQQSAAAEAPPATPEAPATPAAAPGEEAQASVSTEPAAGGDPDNNS